MAVCRKEDVLLVASGRQVCRKIRAGDWVDAATRSIRCIRALRFYRGIVAAGKQQVPLRLRRFGMTCVRVGQQFGESSYDLGRGGWVAHSASMGSGEMPT